MISGLIFSRALEEEMTSCEKKKWLEMTKILWIVQNSSRITVNTMYHCAFVTSSKLLGIFLNLTDTISPNVSMEDVTVKRKD